MKIKNDYKIGFYFFLLPEIRPYTMQNQFRFTWNSDK